MTVHSYLMYSRTMSHRRSNFRGAVVRYTRLGQLAPALSYVGRITGRCSHLGKGKLAAP